MDDDSISSSDRAENCLERTRFCSAFFSLATGLGGTWGLLEGAERLGCENPSTSTRTPSTLTLVGEHLEDDESAFETAVDALLEVRFFRCAFGGSRRTLRCHFVGDRLNPCLSPKNT